MTTEALRPDRPLLEAPAAATPAARRSRRLSRFLSLFLAGAVPVDGGWAPPHLSPAADRCLAK
jgi:hypothetical protein